MSNPERDFNELHSNWLNELHKAVGRASREFDKLRTDLATAERLLKRATSFDSKGDERAARAFLSRDKDRP